MQKSKFPFSARAGRELEWGAVYVFRNIFLQYPYRFLIVWFMICVYGDLCFCRKLFTFLFLVPVSLFSEIQVDIWGSDYVKQYRCIICNRLYSVSTFSLGTAETYTCHSAVASNQHSLVLDVLLSLLLQVVSDIPVIKQFYLSESDIFLILVLEMFLCFQCKKHSVCLNTLLSPVHLVSWFDY